MTQRRPEKIEQAATRLLLQQRLYSLRPDITKLQFEREILFDTVQNFCAVTRTTRGELARNGDTRDGLTLIRKTHSGAIYIVLYNEDVADWRRRNFTLAHELGHIFLNHTDDGPAEEQEADAFAAQLLLPRILVDQLARMWNGQLTADELSDIFGVSRAAACNRLRALHGSMRFTDDDFLLLQRFSGLLPRPHDPVVTV